jgi:2-keto-4-pentenoate hydratase/2-oxohepta-3-ene-1,7-dioic acid hydratase in catechol pathway
MALYPSDILWMGTDGEPENMKHGDVCEIEINDIGVLRNPVQWER